MVHSTPWNIPSKPEKIRVVFDCSARFRDTSLNDHLLTGPDLINALPGVLCRIREHRIALICDVERMFHRFHVSPRDRDFLRFLRWENGHTKTKPKEYRMRVHIFGASSSPGCANYGFRYLDNKFEKEYPRAALFIRKNFYVDDGLSRRGKTADQGSKRNLRKGLFAFTQICVQQQRSLRCSLRGRT